MKQMRIIPLLVFVSMLAFSIRLAEVVSGVSSLSGAAFAESEEHVKEETHAEEDVPEHAEAPPIPEPDQEGLVFSEDEGEAEVDALFEEEAAKAEPSKWRDSSDEDPGYTAVKRELYQELLERRKTIEAREKALQTREALLKAAEQELDRKFQELSQLRGEIEGLLVTQSEEEKARVQSLVKIYEGMKPKDAARIFDTLDLDILVSVVSSMSERKLSPVLAAMNPERARTITIMLAEQKQLPSLPGG